MYFTSSSSSGTPTLIDANISQDDKFTNAGYHPSIHTHNPIPLIAPCSYVCNFISKTLLFYSTIFEWIMIYLLTNSLCSKFLELTNCSLSRNCEAATNFFSLKDLLQKSHFTSGNGSLQYAALWKCITRWKLFLRRSRWWTGCIQHFWRRWNTPNEGSGVSGNPVIQQPTHTLLKNADILTVIQYMCQVGRCSTLN